MLLREPTDYLLQAIIKEIPKKVNPPKERWHPCQRSVFFICYNSSCKMSIDRRNRIHFEETADLFNEVRLGYPEALVEDVLALANMPPDGRILEIGCGPGNATLPYAQRGYRITAVELGQKLAAIAAQKLAPYPNVQIVNTAFEDWPLEASAFDLAISAEAMHWIPPEIGYPKVAGALKPGGSAAFYWNIDGEQQSEAALALEHVIEQFAPEAMRTQKEITAEWLTDNIARNFKTDGRFGPMTVRQYPLLESYTADQYLKLLRTHSIYRTLEKERKKQLFSAVSARLTRFGGNISLPKLALLFLASVQ